jgi:hypothetical protein
VLCTHVCAVIMRHMRKPHDLGLRQAQAFHRESGHLRVSTTHVTDGGYQLGRWLSKQRVALKEGTLCPQRKALLDQMGMVWDAHQLLWEAGLQEARRFRSEHGHLLVAKAYVSPSGYRLGEWIRNRRKSFASDQLNPQRQAELEEIGMVWSARDQLWQRGLLAAREHSAKHGHLRVPQGHVTPCGFQLGAWLKGRRKDHAEDRLCQHKTAALTAVGMSWSPGGPPSASPPKNRGDTDSRSEACAGRTSLSPTGPQSSRSYGPRTSRAAVGRPVAPEFAEPAAIHLQSLCVAWARPSMASPLHGAVGAPSLWY